MILRKMMLGLVFLAGANFAFAQLSGTKTINPSGSGPNNYTTFGAAVRAVNAQGVGAGGVVFNVSAGVTFNEDIPKLTATGTRSNRIVFRKNGTGANPVVTPVTAGTISTAGARAKGEAIFMIVGGDFITIDGIDLADNLLFTTNTLRYDYGYLITRRSATNGSKNVTIQNCRISMNPAHNYATGIFLSVFDSNGTKVVVTSQGGTADSNTFRSNYLNDCYNGIQFEGYNAPAPYTLHDKGNRIIGDSIVNFGGAATSAYGIFTYYQTGMVVDSNYIVATQPHTTSLYGMYFSTAINANYTVRYNYIKLNSTASSSTMYAFYLSTGTNAPTKTNYIEHNTVDQCTQTGTGSHYAFYVTSAPGKLYYHHNKVLNYNRVAATGTVYGHYLSGDVVDSAFVYENEFNNINGGATFTPLYVSHAKTCYTEVYDNRITNNNNTGIFNGINIVLGGVTKVYRNLVSNNTTTTTSASVYMYGINATGGVENYFYNNIISGLYATASISPDGIRGIYLAGSANHSVFHNTVYLNATSSGANFGSSAVSALSTAKVQMRNNIFINLSVPKGTGLTTAYRRSTSTINNYALNSDRNLFYAGTPDANHLIFYDGSNLASTLNDYRAMAGLTGQDVYSVTGLPTFLNVSTHPYDLNIDPAVATQAASAGLRIVSPFVIDQDFAGNTRPAGNVDLGAFEGNLTRNDLTGPGIGYAALRSTSFTTNRSLINVIMADLSGVDVTSGKSPRLYFKKSSEANTYVGNNNADNGWKWVEANNSSSPFNFTFDYSLLTSAVVLGDTIQYFIVAQDSGTTPNIGYNAVSFNIAPTSVNLLAAQFPVTGTRNYSIVNSISGTILVGTGQTYTSLTNANGVFDDINKKVLTGNLNVRITSDLTNETGNISLLEFPEDGPGGYRITITSDAAVKRTISGTPLRSLIRIVGADRVTIDGRISGAGQYLEFKNRSQTTNTVGIHIASKSNNGLNTANDIIIRNVIVSVDTTLSATYGIFIGDSAVGTASRNEGGDNIQILENKVFKAYYGIYASGKDDDIQLTNLVIERNDIGSTDTTQTVSFRGIYVYGALGARIQYNKVHDIMFSRATTVPVGIELAASNREVLMNGNQVYRIANYLVGGTSTVPGAYGINIIGGEGNIVSNNAVYGIISGNASVTSSSGGSYGIRITSGIDHKIYYNTVHLYGNPTNGHTTAGGISAAFVVTSTAVEGLDIRNNIFSNKINRNRTGSISLAMLFPTDYDFSLITIDRNAYFVNPVNTATTSYYVARVGTTASTLVNLLDRAALRAATEQDNFSQPKKNELAPFVNDTTFIIASGTITPAESQGEEIQELGLPNKDITGANRPAGTGTAPDMGAYEFDGASGLDFTPPVIDSFKVDIAGNRCDPTARTITAWIRDNTGGIGVDTVVLNASVGGSDLAPIYMNIIAGTPASGTWSGILPPQTRGEDIHYYIIARDSAENLSNPSADSSFMDGYLTLEIEGPDKDINAGRAVTLVAKSPNSATTITWAANGFANDTLVTPVLSVPTWFVVTVTDPSCSFTDSIFINVVTPVKPVADFYVDNNTVYISDPLLVTDQSTNLPDEWEWRFSPSTVSYINGTTANSQNPEVIFTQAGKYSITLLAKNPAGIDSVTKTDEVDVILTYCTNFSNSGATHYINKVQLDSIQNAGSGFTPGLAYEDYSFSNPSIRTRINAGRSYRLGLGTASATSGAIAAFIDYNRNGSFDDAGEKLGELRFLPTTIDTAIYFTTPGTLSSGDSRLRVMYMESGINLQSCAASLSGEVEDYLINICEVNDNPLPASVEICSGDSILLDALNSGATYTWSNGATSKTIYASQPGWYKVNIIGGACDGADSILVQTKPGFAGVDFVAGTNFGGILNDGNAANPDQVCGNASVNYELTPPVAYGNAGFARTWFFYPEKVMTASGTQALGSVIYNAPLAGNNGSIEFRPAPADADSTFLISFQYINLLSGCDSTVVRHVKVEGIPLADLGPDQSTCDVAPITLDAANPGSTYLWSDGSTAQTLNVTTSGKYWVHIRNAAGCSSSDTVLVQFNQPQAIELGDDQKACTGDIIRLDAGVTGVSYLWSTGATTRTINVSSSGRYSLTVTTPAGCVSTDSVVITFNAKPTAAFTATQTGGSTFTFTPNVLGKTYLWTFGNGYLSSLAQPVIDFQVNGVYSVHLQVTDTVTGCTDTSSQLINLTTTGIAGSEAMNVMINAYPNPFTEQAVVEVYLPADAIVGMEVTDITGRVFESLAPRSYAAGTQQFTVHAAANSAGVYLVRLKINDTEKVIKLTEIK